jgi:hypothetical protein
MLCLALLLAVGRPPAVRADKAESSLEKYRKPVDEAIDKALAYLAKKQHKEGWWPSSMGKSTAVASLSVMAFLSKGYTPGTGPYGDHINRGIDFVLSQAKPNGLLCTHSGHGAMYDHGISTLMVSEISGMVDPARQEKIDKALPAAIKLILAAQQVKKHEKHRGGWRYQPQSRDSDISCTGWQLMSLRSARMNGASIPDKAIKEAVEYVIRCRDHRAIAAAKKGKLKKGEGIGFCYTPGSSPGLARTGTGVLCLELCGRHRSRESLAGADWILKHPARTVGSHYFYYGLYYCSQAMFQVGGRHWEAFAPYMYEMMIKVQRKDGSWPQGKRGESKAGPCYSTAMGVLALAVSYRQLPIYQR